MLETPKNIKLLWQRHRIGGFLVRGTWTSLQLPGNHVNTLTQWFPNFSDYVIVIGYGSALGLQSFTMYRVEGFLQEFHSSSDWFLWLFGEWWLSLGTTSLAQLWGFILVGWRILFHTHHTQPPPRLSHFLHLIDSPAGKSWENSVWQSCTYFSEVLLPIKCSFWVCELNGAAILSTLNRE